MKYRLFQKSNMPTTQFPLSKNVNIQNSKYHNTTISQYPFVIEKCLYLNVPKSQNPYIEGKV